MVYRLLYVSRSLLPEGTADEAVTSIIEVSQVRNTREKITGALLFSGDHFVQVLEGEMAAVLRLMGDISADPRHTDIEIAEQGSVPTRLFAAWSMGYWGRSQFVSRLVREMRPKAGYGQPSGSSGLLSFMLEWARKQSA